MGAFSRSHIPGGIATIKYNGGVLDLLVRRHPEAETTIVMFHAAVKRAASRPIFSGLGVTKDLNANIVLVSDPTLDLHERLTLAWFAGNRRQRLQADLPGMLQQIFEKLGTAHKIFYGGSGGGYASLYYSSLFPRSLAIASNPQTSIGKFWPRTVTDYVSAAFYEVADVPSAVEVLSDRKIIHDLCAHYGERRSNSVAYLQNSPDARHVWSHLLPFYKATAPGTANYLLGDWGPGHHAPPRQKIVSVLQTAVNAGGNWPWMMTEEGFSSDLHASELEAQSLGGLEGVEGWFA